MEEKNKNFKAKTNLFRKILSLSYTKKTLITLATVVVLIGIAVLVCALIDMNNPDWDMNWYGFLIGSAIVLCVIMGQYACVKQGYYSDLLFDYAIIAVICAFGGGVLYFGFSNNFNFAGIGVIGALFGAVIGLVLTMLFYKFIYNRYAEKKKPYVRLTQMLDLAGVFVLFGQCVGRIGCYFGECCYGIPVDFDFFPFSYEVHGVLHLGNPFIESIWCLMGFIPLLILYLSKRKSFNGFYISVYCIWYGIERFVLEFFRDPAQKLQANGGFGDGFGISQVTSLLMIAFGVIWIAQYIIRAKIAGKKIMILVPKDKLSDDYFEYDKTIYAHPQGDGEGNPYVLPITNANFAETTNACAEKCGETKVESNETVKNQTDEKVDND